MKLSISMATYCRKDGSTIKYLSRALDSVFNQTHQDFKIYLIGDRYENLEEINFLLLNYDKDKIYFENLPVAKAMLILYLWNKRDTCGISILCRSTCKIFLINLLQYPGSFRRILKGDLIGKSRS